MHECQTRSKRAGVGSGLYYNQPGKSQDQLLTKPKQIKLLKSGVLWSVWNKIQQPHQSFENRFVIHVLNSHKQLYEIISNNHIINKL